MRTLITACAVALGLLGPALAQNATAPTIEIMSPWARATPGGAKNGAAYMTIVNKGKEANRLIAVATPAAKMAEMHRTVSDNGVMKMLPVEGVDVKAGSQAVFKPGGYHVMLMDLTEPLVEGSSFPLTLTFAKAGKIEVTVKVQKVGASSPDMGGMKMN